MQKYVCNTCEKKFQQEPAANLICPECGSNNVSELQQTRSSGGGSFLDQGGYIISGIILFLMVITLFLLPSMKPKIIVLPPVDPCDCRRLKIISVDTTIIKYRKAIVIHSTLPRCHVEYSITGSDGKYQPDSTFYPISSKNNIFVKIDTCGAPIAYLNNPFIISIKPYPSGTTKPFQESEIDIHPHPAKFGEDRTELLNYIKSQVQDMGIQGGMTISFTVEKAGDVSNIVIKPQPEQAINSKITKIIVDIGAWVPGYKDGNPENTIVVLQILKQ